MWSAGIAFALIPQKSFDAVRCHRCCHGIVKCCWLVLGRKTREETTHRSKCFSYFILPGSFQVQSIVSGNKRIRFVGHKASFSAIIGNFYHKYIFAGFQQAIRQRIPALRVHVGGLSNLLPIDIQHVSIHDSSQKNLCRHTNK